MNSILGHIGIKKKIKRILPVAVALSALLPALCLFSGCGKNNSFEITSLEDFKKPGIKIAVPQNMIEYDMLKTDYPEAVVTGYNDNQLAYEDVANGRIDAFVYSRIQMEVAIDNGTKGVKLLDEVYSKNPVAIGISPKSHIPDLEKKIDAFLKEIRKNGILDDMFDRWVRKKDDSMPDIPKPEHPKEKLVVATTGVVMPFSYFAGTELKGYDIEMGKRFASWLNADIEFKIYDYGGIVSAAATGDADCIMSNLFMTEENKQAIGFSDPLFDEEIIVMVRDTGTSGAFTSLSELQNGNIAILTGSNFAEHVLFSLPDANLMYFNSIADEVSALMGKKVDAVAVDEPVARNIMAQNKGVTVISE